MNEGEMKTGHDEANGFKMPWFGVPKFAFGEVAERGVARAQEGCEKMKAVSEDMADALRDAYASNARGAADYGLKMIEISKANTTSALEFVSHLMESRSLSDVLSVSATEARRAFETTAAQNRELWQLAERLAKETGEPIRNQVAKVFRQAS